MFENRQIALIEGKCRRFRNSSGCLKTRCADLDAQRAKRSVKMWTTTFYKSFFKNILLFMRSQLSKTRSVHTYAMPRTVYFGWICTRDLYLPENFRDQVWYQMPTIHRIVNFVLLVHIYHIHDQEDKIREIKLYFEYPVCIPYCPGFDSRQHNLMDKDCHARSLLLQKRQIGICKSSLKVLKLKWNILICKLEDMDKMNVLTRFSTVKHGFAQFGRNCAQIIHFEILGRRYWQKPHIIKV